MNENKKGLQVSNFVKIPYFDEEAAQDYLDIKNKGRLDWTTDENKDKLAKIVGEIESEVGGGLSIGNILKAVFQARGDISYSSTLSKTIESKLRNTLLTDYIILANDDSAVIKLENISVHPYRNSFTMYKIFSSYLTVVPKENVPVDMEKLNKAMLEERGYYELVAEKDTSEYILRFNINSFRNGYHLTDLSKMKLVYYGILVGEMQINRLGIDKEFDFVDEYKEVSAEEVVEGSVPEKADKCKVYDVILAGVKSE